MPTSLNIASYDINNCEGVVGNLWNLIYVLELVIIILMTFIGFLTYKRALTHSFKKQVVLFTSGTVIFSTIFFLSNFYGEITRVYEFNLWGPVGMAAFLIVLGYMMTTYKLFNMKIFSTQLFIIILWTLLASLLFIENIDYIHIVVGCSAILFLGIGIQLIKSVQQEIDSREKIERLAKELESANSKLKEVDALKSEFLSFASHQLRNPLTAVKGYASLVIEGDYGKVKPEILGVFKTISDSTQNLLVMVQEFLDISKIEQGGMKYDMGPIDLKKLVTSVVDQTKPNIEIKNLTYSLSIPEGMEYHTQGDENKLRQVFINIIDNCIKYTPTGSLSMTLGKTNGKILFTIVDTGVGISAEDIPKLFGKFNRATGANKINVIGSGLGLYLAKQIIEAHKGYITVASPGKGLGSTFTVELPS